MPQPNIAIIWTHVFGVICGLQWIQTQTPKYMRLKRGWSMCLIYANHSKLNKEHDQREECYMAT